MEKFPAWSIEVIISRKRTHSLGLAGDLDHAKLPIPLSRDNLQLS